MNAGVCARLYYRAGYILACTSPKDLDHFISLSGAEISTVAAAQMTSTTIHFSLLGSYKPRIIFMKIHGLVTQNFSPGVWPGAKLASMAPARKIFWAHTNP